MDNGYVFSEAGYTMYIKVYRPVKWSILCPLIRLALDFLFFFFFLLLRQLPRSLSFHQRGPFYKKWQQGLTLQSCLDTSNEYVSSVKPIPQTACVKLKLISSKTAPNSNCVKSVLVHTGVFCAFNLCLCIGKKKMYLNSILVRNCHRILGH